MKQFAAGCVVGALAMYLFALQHPNPAPSPLAVAEPSAPAAPAADPEQQEEELPAAAEPVTPEDGARSSSAWAEAREDRAEGPWSGAPSLPNDETLDSAETLDGDPAEPRTRTPVITSEEHQDLLAKASDPDDPLYGNGRVAQLHEDFEHQEADMSWSYQAEQYLQGFLAGHPGISQFDIRQVECRQNLCELHVFGYDDRAGRLWGDLIADMGNEPWWTEFEGNSSISAGENGRTTIVTILQRRGYEAD